MVTIYGIKNCDTVQCALKSLDAAGIAHRFHDFKTAGLSLERAQAWIDALGVDVIVNRKGTTWRRIDEASRAGLGADTAASLLVRETSLVKRPVIEWPGGVLAGFSKADESAILARLQA